jgi:hypothetical protein
MFNLYNVERQMRAEAERTEVAKRVALLERRKQKCSEVWVKNHRHRVEKFVTDVSDSGTMDG